MEIKGQSYTIPKLSLEYTPERIGPVIDSITYLATLRVYEHNYSVAESTVLARADWVDTCPGFYRWSSSPKGTLGDLRDIGRWPTKPLMSL
jgi:hypothetical protein